MASRGATPGTAVRRRPDERRDTRLRFEQWAKNPACQANTMSAVNNVAGRGTGEQALVGADAEGLGDHRHVWAQQLARLVGNAVDGVPL